jgi:hypothetical protein
MNRTTLILTLAGLMASGLAVAQTCEYKQGETKFVDYANCRYGEENVVVVDLPDDSSWDNCIYYMQAFKPSKLLAVSRERNGKEELSVNDRTQIGNPCYLTKRQCDAVLKVYKKKEGIF